MKKWGLLISLLMASGILVFLWIAIIEEAGATTRISSLSVPSSTGDNFRSPTAYSGLYSTSQYSIYIPIAYSYVAPCSAAPMLIEPIDGAALSTLIPEMTYLRGSSPVSYTVVTIADSPDLTLWVQQYFTYGEGIGPDTLKLFNNLEPATKYYWQVYDVCDDVESPASAVFSFTTGSGGVILPSPVLISPVNGATGLGSEETFTWSSVNGAAGYQLRVGDPTPSGAGILYFTSDTSELVRNLTPNSTYGWDVLAYNDYAYGTSSDTWQFSTDSFQPTALEIQDHLLLERKSSLFTSQQESYTEKE